MIRPCEHCGCVNVGPCESQIPEIYIKDLDKCYTCNSIFTKPDENDTVFFLHVGFKE